MQGEYKRPPGGGKKRPRGWYRGDKDDLTPDEAGGACPAAKATGEGVKKSKKGEPTTVLEKVRAAILALGQPSSAQAIHKYSNEMWGYDNVKMIRKLLKQRGGGSLITITAQKFWVKDVPVPLAPVVPTVEVQEKKEGEGDPVENGDAVLINYSLALATEPDAVVEKGKGFDFTVGAGDVIKGMDAGVRGLKLGGERVIQVPWSLGYGKRGSKPDIPPEANLIFAIELIMHTRA